MFVRSKAMLIDLADLQAQVRGQLMAGDEKGDADWYAPELGLDGAMHLVRVPLAGSNLKALKRARAEEEKASREAESGEGSAEGAPYLVSAFKSGKCRAGMRGIPAKARRQINRRAQVLGAFPMATSFGTIGFSDAQVALMALCPDGMQVWQEVFRHRLQRLLKAKTDRPLFVLRDEMHPKRSAAVGRPIPHVHFLARTKPSRWSPETWLTPGDVKEACREGFAAVVRRCQELGVLTGRSADGLVFDQQWIYVAQDAMFPPRVDLQWAKDPAAYLAKYVSKNEDGTASTDLEACPNLVPHQWHACSKELLAAERACAARFPGEFAEWVWRNGGRIEREGLGRIREWSPPDCSSYRITTLYIRKPEQLACLWESFLFETGYGRWLDPDAPSPASSEGPSVVRSLWTCNA